MAGAAETSAPGSVRSPRASACSSSTCTPAPIANDADGLIIRFTRQLSRVSELPTKLVTRDLGMRLRAAGLGVDAVQLPD